MPGPIVCLHHLTTPILGFAAEAFETVGVEIAEVDVARGEPLPDLDAVGGILTLGGDQSVVDLDGQVELSAEVAFLRDAVSRGLPVLGVCLGGQLLARALGAPVTHMPEKMVGWYEVAALPAAAQDPLFSRLPASVTLFHWNEDAFALPPARSSCSRAPGPASRRSDSANARGACSATRRPTGRRSTAGTPRSPSRTCRRPAPPTRGIFPPSAKPPPRSSAASRRS